MKNRFEINSEEIKRILSLHEDATKNHYLNILNEQAGVIYKTTALARLNDNYNIQPGTVFKVKKPGVLFATVSGTNYGPKGKVKWFKEDKVNIYFYCKQGKYYFDKDTISKDPGKTPRYDDGGLSTNLVKNLCRAKKTDYLSIGGHSFGSVYKIPPQTKFTKVKDGVYFKAVKTESEVYNAYIPGDTRVNTKKTIVNAFFSCSDYKFYADKKAHSEDNGTVMTSTLKKQFCATTTPGNKEKQGQQKVQQGQQNQQGQQKVQQGQSQVQQGQAQGQQQFAQQVQQYNTQIQTSLGVQQPTGQITTADIDAIMTKLG